MKTSPSAPVMFKGVSISPGVARGTAWVLDEHTPGGVCGREVNLVEWSMVRKLKSATEASREVMTVGHSTRPIEEFIGLLQEHGVACVVDVRTIPRSRHNPQFNADTLKASLKKAGIGYRHMPGLGGLRHTTAASVNTGWRNSSFRGFADYMQTPPFERALESLIKLASRRHVALMCAEAVPWRCHRSLIADALLVRGIPAEHIMSRTRRQPHQLTPFAKVRGSQITYPADKPSSRKVQRSSLPNSGQHEPQPV